MISKKNKKKPTKSTKKGKEADDEEEADEEEADEEEEDEENIKNPKSNKATKKDKNKEEEEENKKNNKKTKEGTSSGSSSSTLSADFMPNIAVLPDWSNLLKEILRNSEAENKFLNVIQNEWYSDMQKNEKSKGHILPIFKELYNFHIISRNGFLLWKETVDGSKSKVQVLIKINTWLSSIATTLKEKEEDDEEEEDEEAENPYLQNPNKEFLT